MRCLLQKPKLLIMDEPTSVLTPQEVERLFETLRQLAERRLLDPLHQPQAATRSKRLCDRATILRGGKVVAHCDPRSETARSMARADDRRRAQGRQPHAARRGTLARPRLDGRRTSSLPSEQQFGIDLKDISFAVRAGEIFGIAGVAGNGQNELLLALSGETLAAERRRDPHRRRRRSAGSGRASGARSGCCCVPEERNGHGAVPRHELADNALLSRPRSGMGLLAQRPDPAGKAARLRRRRDRELRRAHDRASARWRARLSGGNLQKFIVGREVLQSPEVLVVSQPTWGVDAGAAAAIHQALIDLAGNGAAVLVISQDLDELLALADRLAVINGGRLSQRDPDRARPSVERDRPADGRHSRRERGSAIREAGACA